MGARLQHVFLKATEVFGLFGTAVLLAFRFLVAAEETALDELECFKL